MLRSLSTSPSGTRPSTKRMSPWWKWRGWSTASWGVMWWSIKFDSSCAWPWGCIGPPITPKAAQRAPSFVARPGMILLQTERGAPVLEADAGALRHHAAAEAHVEAVYERAAVALGVHGAQVGRVLPERRLDHLLGGPIRRDALA